jgi:hypothetical protein
MTVLIKILTKVSLHLEIIDNDILESTSYVVFNVNGKGEVVGINI